MPSFTAKIEIINGNPYVHLPTLILEAIFSQAGKSKGPIPVKGQLNQATFSQTLVKYQGDWRLYLNGIMLKNAGIPFKTGNILSVVGQTVDINLKFDPVSRKLLMHPKLWQALLANPLAKTTYDSLAPYRQHEILRYLGFLKTEESVDRNIKRIIQHLNGIESDALYALMHRKK